MTLLWLLALPAQSFAADEAPGAGDSLEDPATGQRAGSVTTLQQVTVVGQPEPPLTVADTLSSKTIKALPGQNGSMNESLRVLPGIQYSETTRTSDNAGEILPPSLSISGGRFYENNFMIDGIGNNSLLDPSSSDIDNTSDTPGHPQERFIHPGLIESITVQRANISARYGQFTGGVVEVETRDPAEEFGGEVNLRHTRSEWTQIHRHHDRKSEYWQPADGSVQPKFIKYDGHVSLDIPIDETSGMLASYSRIYSQIPLYQIQIPSLVIDETDQERILENYFLKYVTYPGDDTKWSLSWSYSPYDAVYFRDEVVNSRYTVENSSFALASNLERRIGNLKLEFDASYSKSSNDRIAPPNNFNWQVTPSKPWGAVTDADKTFQYSKEGGYGNLEKEQESKSLKLHFALDPFKTEALEHKLSFGIGYEDVDGQFLREEEFNNYILARANDNVVCADGAIDCITGEQFMWYKLVYPAENTLAKINFYDAYIEDEVSIGSLTVRPGVRASRDDLQDNLNLAPRLSAAYDLFGDGSTRLFAGANRYYGKTLLTHALKDERAPATVWFRSPVLNADNTPKDWTARAPRTIVTTRLSELDTPYTDEWTVGFDQELFGGTLNVSYIDRDSDDELSSTVVDEISLADGLTYKYTEWANGGSSEHQEVGLSWEREWPNHYLMVNATWQETETSNIDYEERVDYPDDNDDGMADPVWYAGGLYDRGELPRPDFNRAYTGSLTYIGKLPYGFAFTNVTRYRSGYKALVDSEEDYLLPSGDEIPIYIEKKQPESWTTDWRLDWEKALYKGHIFIASLEVNNVFNEKVATGGNDDVFNLGRQFWLGITYKF